MHARGAGFAEHAGLLGGDGGRVSWGEEVGGRGGAYILDGERECEACFRWGTWIRITLQTEMLCCTTFTLIDLLPTPPVLELLQ